MTIEKLKQSDRYHMHHTARARGYVSRKCEGIVQPYNGRFGCGYKVLRPAYDSTTYCYVDYYIQHNN